MAHAFQVDVLQNVQSLNDRDCAAGRQRRSNDLVVPVGPANGFQIQRPVRRKILQRGLSVEILNRFHHLFCKWTFIEIVCPLILNLLQRFGQFRLLEDGADRRKKTIRSKHLPHGWPQR